MNRTIQNPDEFVLEDVKMVHLESMSPEHLWVGCYTKDNRIFHLNIFANGDRLLYYWSDETLEEPSQGHTRTDLDAL
jgi:hypothetical protein